MIASMAMALEVDVQVAVANADLPSYDQFQAWAIAAWQMPDEAAGVVIRIVDRDESRTLNETYRHQDKATNVLSFPYEVMPGAEVHHVGDLVICAPVVLQEAEDQAKPIAAHWAHMVVHGMLHLQGFDHTDDQQAERMESLETSILRSLGFPAPYATDEPQ